jgi:acetyltransferase
MPEREMLTLPGLGAVAIRPLEAGDRAAYLDFAARLTPEDIRLRFFRPIWRLDGRLLAELLDIDHDRREAFVAMDETGAILGVARVVEGEFALIVRSDLKRRGLGRVLLDRLVRYAIERGFIAVDGTVLAENEPMLNLARHAGFRAVGREVALRLCLP